MILEEARKLREMAGFYHYPEAPVATHFAAGSRCFFSRYSAPTSNPDDLEAEAERKLILADAKNLKVLSCPPMQRRPDATTLPALLLPSKKMKTSKRNASASWKR